MDLSILGLQSFSFIIQFQKSHLVLIKVFQGEGVDEVASNINP